jgi:UDP-N-acetylglucosamine enolpyruvyl transferase
MSDNDNLIIRDGQTVLFIGDSLTHCGYERIETKLAALGADIKRVNE